MRQFRCGDLKMIAQTIHRSYLEPFGIDYIQVYCSTRFRVVVDGVYFWVTSLLMEVWHSHQESMNHYSKSRKEKMVIPSMETKDERDGRFGVSLENHQHSFSIVLFCLN